MYSTIQDAPVKTETRVVGIAASAAGFVSQAGDKRTIKPYALWHGHSARAPKGKTAKDSEINIANSLISEILTSRTGMSQDEVSAILGTETLLKASDAKSKGLFDEVLPSAKPGVKINETMNSIEIMDLFNGLEDKKKVKNMSKVNQMLDLEAEASEQAQISAITTLKASVSKIGDLENANSELKAKVETLEASLATEKTAKAQALVNTAVEAGKLSKEDEEAQAAMLEMATSNYEGAEKILGGINAVVASSKIIETVNKGVSEDKKGWGFEKWSKEDPKGLENLKNSNPEKFEELLNAYAEEA